MQIVFKWAIIAGSTAFSVCASAQNIDTGKVEFQSSCGACHGINGKGDGPVGKVLKARPTDLTVLAKKNNGVFPRNALYEIIDGRNQIASHGTPEMPIWGYRFVPPEHFLPKKADDYVYSPPASPEPIIHRRISAVIDYLSSIQEK